MQNQVFSEEKTILPFGMSDLTAGLRKNLGDLSIQVQGVRSFPIVHKQPSISRVIGLELDLQSRSGDRSIRVVVKEPGGLSRIGQAGAGTREVGVYRSLSDELPMDTPALLASSDTGDWLVLEYVSGCRDPVNWSGEDYLRAVSGLVDLHDRFWDLGGDLLAFPWLARPLGADFEIHVGAAARSIESVVYSGKPCLLAGNPGIMSMLADLTLFAEEIKAALLEQPHVLLHGSYWPGNLAVEADKQILFDWAHAGTGPAVLDLVGFCKKSAWWFTPVPAAECDIACAYRAGILDSTGYQWPDHLWDRVWDAALLWVFLQDWVDLLAASPDSVLESRRELLETIWFDPVRSALKRLLGGSGS